MIAANYAPSIWRVQKTLIMVLRIAILGHIALNAMLAAPTRFHRLLAEPPRKRKLQVQYPLNRLS
jgi:hypothetical protein